jgi:hypothetical protein
MSQKSSNFAVTKKKEISPQVKVQTYINTQMNYPFKNIERKVYPKTFLKDVRIILDFNGNSVAEDSVAKFFESHFGSLKIDKGVEFKGMSVNSDDRLIKFDFGLSRLELVMRHPAYRTFDYALQWIPIIEDYLKSLKIDTVSKLTLSKYNELGYTLFQNSIGVDVIMQQVFSNEMMTFGGADFMSEKKTFANMARWERFGTFDGHDEWNSLFSFEYGFSRTATDRNKGCLTLKTTMETQECSIVISDIRKCLEAFNLVLDRGFHWCVTDGIVKKMEK